MRIRNLLTGLIASACVAQAAQAADYTLTLKNHTFSPAEITIPANQKIKLTVKNEQDTPAEFESTDIDREKGVSAHGTVTIYVGPLNPGHYKYYDDFHRASNGVILAK